jgi:peptide/nickel transport system permease protein
VAPESVAPESVAQSTLGVAGESPVVARSAREQSYRGAVWHKLAHDRITVAAALLLIFVIALSLGASWIGDHVLGFNPTATDLLNRNKPPTWASQAWPRFEQFTATCQTGGGCDWSAWPQILRDSFAGVQACLVNGFGRCHWFGTDEAGRDVLTRGIFGGRISLRIGAYVALISMTLGVVAGLVSGYYATTLIDDIVNAIIMTIGSIPLLFLLIIISRIFQPGPEGLAFMIGIFGWTGISRLVRGQVFALREREYILASQSVGCTTWRIIFQHILPNVSSIVIVSAVFNVAGAIIAEAGLSYLGVGIGPPLPSWGNMMQGSLGSFSTAPWLVITPGIFIFLTTLAVYLIGDGLRDALDPWHAGS